MKTLGFLLLILSLNTNAVEGIAHYNKVVNEIKSLESTGQHQLGAFKAITLANQIAEKIKLDQKVAAIATTLDVRKKEFVTKTDSNSAGFNFLGLAKISASTSYDVTKIMTLNAEEVEGFGRKEARDLSSLQRDLRSYLEKNESEIYYAKILAAKAIQLATKLDLATISEIQPLLAKTAQRVSQVSFIGVQGVLVCTTVDFAARKDEAGLKIKSLFFSLNLGEETEHFAHQETECASRDNVAQVSESEIYSVDLMLADQSIEAQSEILGLKLLKKEAPVYPTWGW